MLNDTNQIEPAKEVAQRRKKLAQGPRRNYSLDFKLQVLKETFAPDVSVAVVARRHGMNTNVIFRWRKEYREGRLGENTAAFVPVRLTQDRPALPVPRTPGPVAVADTKPASRKKAGHIEVTLPGGFTVRADADIDEAALRRVLWAVRELS